MFLSAIDPPIMYPFCVGIGREIVNSLMRHPGVTVIGLDKQADKLAELETMFGAEPGSNDEPVQASFKTIKLDLTDWEGTRRAVGQIEGKISGLVNCAGVVFLTPIGGHPIQDLNLDHLKLTLDINLKVRRNH